MHIHKRGIGDIISKLPHMEPLSHSSHIDILITTLGFEDRSPTVTKESANYSSLDRSVILLIKYPTNETENEINFPYFVAAAKNASAELVTITYNRNTFRQDIVDFLCQHSTPNTRIALDISTCSSYVFYPIMKSIFQLDCYFKVVYTEADTYYPTKDEWENVKAKAEKEDTLYVKSFENAQFQSSGVDEVYSSPLFFETNPLNKPPILAAFPNFSCSRMNAIIAKDYDINKTDYDDVIWLLGEPPAPENRWRLDAVKHTNYLHLRDNARIQSVSTLNYLDTLMALENIWSDAKYSHHLSIAPLGSKNQHLGIFFFLFIHQDVGLWLAEPMEFKANRFSEGSGTGWQIDFGLINEMRHMLLNYMKFRWKFCE